MFFINENQRLTDTITLSRFLYEIGERRRACTRARVAFAKRAEFN